MITAKDAPMSMGHTKSCLPIKKIIPIGNINPLAAEKVAPDIAVCNKFCLFKFLYLLKIAKGTCAMIIATKAPMIDVLGVVPNLVINSSPTMAPNADKTTIRNSVPGSKG